MPSPSLVIFDMDDVLCRYDLGRRLRALSAISRKTPRDIRAAVWDSGFEDAADAGQYATSEAYLSGFAERLGHPLTRADWVAARKEAMTPDPEVLAFAARCAARCPSVLFTNNGPLLKETLAELFPEASSIFGSNCYCSYEFAAKKPDPVVYCRLLDRLEVKPSEAWFIDDKKSNVDGARIAGLAAHHFVNYRSLARAAHILGL